MIARVSKLVYNFFQFWPSLFRYWGGHSLGGGGGTANFNSVGQTQTVDQQTGETNEVNIVVKCFIRFPIPYL